MIRFVFSSVLMLSTMPVLASTEEFLHPLPFAPNKNAFLEHMSRVSYDKDGKVEFFEAQNCYQPRNLSAIIPGGPGNRLNQNAYECKEAYYRKSSPLGTEVCKVKHLYYQGARRWKGKVYMGGGGYSLDRCRFKG